MCNILPREKLLFVSYFKELGYCLRFFDAEQKNVKLIGEGEKKILYKCEIFSGLLKQFLNKYLTFKSEQLTFDNN